MNFLVAAILFFVAAILAITAVTALLPLVLAIFLLGLAVAFFVFWVWMLVDAIRNPGLQDGEKICWVLAIIFLHVLGAPLYFCLGRRKGFVPDVSQ